MLSSKNSRISHLHPRHHDLMVSTYEQNVVCFGEIILSNYWHCIFGILFLPRFFWFCYEIYYSHLLNSWIILKFSLVFYGKYFSLDTGYNRIAAFRSDLYFCPQCDLNFFFRTQPTNIQQNLLKFISMIRSPPKELHISLS